MAKQILEYRCLLISPSDVERERESLEEGTRNWNAHVGSALGARVELVRWERHSTPELGDSPQNIINRQLVDNCDLGVAVFWSRLGTPTDKHASGSVEEIFELSRRGCPVVVYFSNQNIPQDSLKDDQFKNLTQIKVALSKKGLLASYNDPSHLKDQFQLHLTSQVSKLLSRERNFADPKENKLSSSKPDIRVSVNNSIAIHPHFVICSLGVDVQNHSPILVFVGNIYLLQKNGQLLFAVEDYLTKSQKLRDKIEPGESISINIDPQVLISHRDKLKCALFKDKIGRSYESDPKEFESKIEIVLKQYRENGENKGFDTNPFLFRFLKT